MDDVGLRATFEDAALFLRDADRVNRAMDGLARNAIQTASETKRASTGMFDGFRRGAQTATQAADQAATASRRMSTSATAASRARDEFGRFASEGRGAGGLLERIIPDVGGGVRSILGLAGGFGLAALGVREFVNVVSGIGGAVLGASADFEQMQLTMETMLGSAEAGRAKLEELSDFARRTPFELPEVVTASNQLLAFGFTADELIPTLTAVSDAAAGLGEQAMPSIIRALGQIRARGKVSAEELLQLTEAGIPAWQILADAIGISVGELQNLVSKGLVPADQAVSVLVNGIEDRFGGLAARQSKTFNGMLSNLGDFAFRARTAFAEDIFAQAREQLASTLDVLDRPETLAFIRSLGAGVGQVTATILSGFGTAGTVVSNLAGQFGTFLTTLQPIIDAAGRLTATFGDFAGRVGGVMLQNLGQLVDLSIRISPALIVLRRVFGDLSGVTSTVSSVLGTVAGVLDSVASGLEQLSGPGGLATRTLDELGAVLEGTLVTIADRVGPVLADLGGRVAAGFASVADVVGPAIDAIGTRFAEIAPVVDQVLAGVSDLFQTHLGVAVAVVEGVFEGIATVVGTHLDVVFTTVRAALRLIAGDWGGAWQEIERVPAIVMAGVQDGIGAALRTIERILRAAIPGFRLADLWFDIRDFVLSVFHDITAGIATEFNKAADTINGLIADINTGLRLLGREPIEFRIAPIDVGEFVAPERGRLFFEETSDDVADLDANIAKAREGTRDWFGEWLAGLFAPAQSLEATAEEAEEAAFAIDDVGAAAQGLRDAITGGASAGQSSLDALERSTRDVEQALRDAESAMAGFADPRLAGMQAAEDELFELDQAIKRAELAELQAGDTAEETGRKFEDSFDAAAAQQRELAEGIPVAFQRAQHAAEQAQRQAAQAPSGGGEGDEGESELERLRRLRRIKQLESELTFEPQQRALREIFEGLTGANAEITFAEAQAGLEASAAAAATLRQTLADQQAELDAQRAAIEGQQVASGTIAQSRAGTLTTEQQLTALYGEQLATLNHQTGEYLKQKEAIDQMFAVLDKLPFGNVANPFASAEPAATTLPGFADGGDITRAGFGIVGERGPEPVFLPAGARVLPTEALAGVRSGATFNQTNHITSGAQAMDLERVLRDRARMARITMGRGGR